MAIVSGISIDDWQVKELRKVEFENELHLVEEPDGRWTVDNGDMIVLEFVVEPVKVQDAGLLTDAELEADYEGDVDDKTQGGVVRDPRVAAQEALSVLFSGRIVPDMEWEWHDALWRKLVGVCPECGSNACVEAGVLTCDECEWSER